MNAVRGNIIWRSASAARGRSRLNSGCWAVTPEQLRLISYGEEQPAAGGHDEAAWQQNRRVEILY